MPIPLLPLIPIILSMVGGAAQTVASGASNARLRRYNDPAAQLQRLNRAGLPMAAMGNNIANTQSSLPDFSGIGQAADAAGSMFQNVQQLEQIELLKQQVKGADIQNDMSSLDYLTKKEDTDWSMLPAEGYSDGRTNRRDQKMMEYQVQQYSTWMKKNEYELDSLEKTFKEAQYTDGSISKKWIADLDAVINRNKLMKQAWDNIENQQAASNKIIGYFEKGGMSLAEAIFLTIMQSMKGSAGSGGFNMGF